MQTTTKDVSSAFNTNFLSVPMEDVDNHILSSTCVYNFTQTTLDLIGTLDMSEVFQAVFTLLVHKISQEDEIQLYIREKDGQPRLSIFNMSPHAEQEIISYIQYVRDGIKNGYASAISGSTHPSFCCAETGSIFDVTPSADYSSLILTYNPQAISEDRGQMYMTFFERLLMLFLQGHGGPVAKFSLATDADYNRYESLTQKEDYNKQMDLVDLFLSAVEKYPDYVFLQDDSTSITYKEADVQSSALAGVLVSTGVKPNEHVPVFMDRSPSMVIALLGVMKCGGVYTPVDPSYPTERVTHILKDTKASLMLVNTASYVKMSSTWSVDVINIEQMPTAEEPESWRFLTRETAYTIYTSGSTGTPKGTLLGHNGAVNMALAMRNVFHLTETSIIGQFVSFSFDPSIADVFACVAGGSRLHFFSAEERLDPERFASCVKNNAITHLVSLPAAFFNEIATSKDETQHLNINDLHSIGIGGEALPVHSIVSYQAVHRNNTRLVNLYGPTECTVTTTVFEIEDIVSADTTSIPIGYPLPNYMLTIVDKWGAVCPVGHAGELLVASPGLAKGYLNDPVKTHQSFVHVSCNGERIRFYKTGDLAMLTAEGYVEHLGRKDWQVKIRGHRVEIGEIEHVLLSHPSVRQTHVLPVGKSNDKSLVSFCILNDGYLPAEDALMGHLRDALPSYMVPNRMIFLTEFPLSPTGKVDRKKLESMATVKKQDAREIVMARDETERTIIKSWSRVLENNRISVHDDFFAILGGHSLKVIESITELRSEYPFLKIQDFFNNPTVAGLASYIKGEVQNLRLSTHDTLLSDSPSNNMILDEYPRVLADRATTQSTKESTLLTGATGFLGVFLLRELLVNTEDKILCLVRDGNEERLTATLEAFFGPLPQSHAERVEVIAGDLSKPALGLSNAQQILIQERVGTILHCAANVNHFGHSQDFQHVNVESTRFLLGIAERCGASFHYISTMSVVEELSLQGLDILSTSKISHWDLPKNSPYSYSKLESEKLVEDAVNRGVDASIYRMGNLVGTSHDGTFQTNIDSNAFYRMLKAAILLKATPKAHWAVDLTPVDFASRAVITLVKTSGMLNRVHHVCNPKSMVYSDLIDAIRSMGYDVEEMEPAQYQRFVMDVNNHGSDEGLLLAATQLEGNGVVDSNIVFGCSHTANTLDQQSIHCPEPSALLIKTLITHAIEVGFLPANHTVLA